MTISSSNCSQNCGYECADHVFSRVYIRPLIAGGTRVEWELHPEFADATPYTYQLQVGYTGLTTSDDWADVGLPAVDAYFLVDDSQFVYGKSQRTHYRIKLTTSVDTYYSAPANCLGDLSFRDWRLCRSIMRAERVRFRELAGQQGYLLKRRIDGTKCTACRDYQTDEVVNAQCESCYGTGWVSGYFDPQECIWAAVDSKTRHEELKEDRATVNDIIVGARMLAEPQLDEEDVWVARDTDMRWFVHTIKHIAEIRGYPLVYQVELRLAEFSNGVYQIEIPDQVPS